MPDKNNKYFAAHKEITAVARLSIYSNIFLLLIKVAAGFMMGSISVLSEALHTGIDLLAALIANFSVRKAVKPADDIHTFGHGKFENVSGTVEAILIFVAAIIILYKAGEKLINPAATFINSRNILEYMDSLATAVISLWAAKYLLFLSGIYF